MQAVQLLGALQQAPCSSLWPPRPLLTKAHCANMQRALHWLVHDAYAACSQRKAYQPRHANPSCGLCASDTSVAARSDAALPQHVLGRIPDSFGPLPSSSRHTCQVMANTRRLHRQQHSAAAHLRDGLSAAFTAAAQRAATPNAVHSLQHKGYAVIDDVFEPQLAGARCSLVTANCRSMCCCRIAH